MKRFLASVLAILYFTMSTGATVHVQYCMGELVRLSLVADKADDCGHCGMKKNKCSNKCCTEDSKVLKTGDQKAQPHFDFQVSTYKQLPAPISTSFYYASSPVVQRNAPVFLANGPPSAWRTCPIYIQVQNFRI